MSRRWCLPSNRCRCKNTWVNSTSSTRAMRPNQSRLQSRELPRGVRKKSAENNRERHAFCGGDGNQLPAIGTQLARRLQRQSHYPLHQPGKAQAGLHRRLGELIGAIEIGIGVGFEDDDVIRRRHAQVDARNADAQGAIDGFANFAMRWSMRWRTVRRRRSESPCACDRHRPTWL